MLRKPFKVEHFIPNVYLNILKQRRTGMCEVNSFEFTFIDVLRDISEIKKPLY